MIARRQAGNHASVAVCANLPSLLALQQLLRRGLNLRRATVREVCRQLRLRPKLAGRVDADPVIRC